MDPQSITPAILEWKCLDAHPHERSARWYVTGGVFILMFAAYGIYEGSIPTTLVAILMGSLYFLTRNTKPELQRVVIDGLGIVIGGERTEWNKLKDFWILIGQDVVELHLGKRSGIVSEQTVFIEEVDPGTVRRVLLQYLPERPEMSERFLDYCTRILKL